MNTEAPLTNLDSGSKNGRALRPLVLVIALVMAALIAWMLWPSNPGIDPLDLSRIDGKPRFYVTTYSKREMPSGLSLPQKLSWAWIEFKRRHGRASPVGRTFPASPVQPCGIGLLSQCMEVSGTRYFIAVESTSASIEFGNTNALSGMQWVVAFEHAIQTSGPVLCYDYGKKDSFEDTLLLFRERPGVVKIVPRTKLAEYQRAGLVKMVSH